MVQVPTVEQEDSRQLHRELEILKKERTQHINRIKGHLTSSGSCGSTNVWRVLGLARDLYGL